MGPAQDHSELRTGLDEDMEANITLSDCIADNDTALPASEVWSFALDFAFSMLLQPRRAEMRGNPPTAPAVPLLLSVLSHPQRLLFPSSAS